MPFAIDSPACLETPSSGCDVTLKKRIGLRCFLVPLQSRGILGIIVLQTLSHYNLSPPSLPHNLYAASEVLLG
ncbi:UNVERIFIED_CONTAM: hypothetical protein FKN15_053382 [Acipenser sinensis]